MDACLCKQERSGARVHLPVLEGGGGATGQETDEAVVAGPSARLSWLQQNSSPPLEAVLDAPKREQGVFVRDASSEGRSVSPASAPKGCARGGEPSVARQEGASPHLLTGEARAGSASRLRQGLVITHPAAAPKGRALARVAPVDDVPASRADTVLLVARALAVLGPEPSSASAYRAVAAVPRAGPEPLVDDDQLGELLAAQERARRKLGLGP
jgi:hypothetical protein